MSVIVKHSLKLAYFFDFLAGETFGGQVFHHLACDIQHSVGLVAKRQKAIQTFVQRLRVAFTDNRLEIFGVLRKDCVSAISSLETITKMILMKSEQFEFESR